MHLRLLLVSAVLTSQAFAQVSFHEKKNRVEYLESLSSQNTSMNIDAFRKELQYEKQNLPLEKRAADEAQQLAEKIRLRIESSYHLALESNTPDEAQEIVKKAIDRDLELISPELQEEVRALSYAALAEVQRGGMSNFSELTDLPKHLMKGIEERSKFLNEEAKVELPPALYQSRSGVPGNEELKYSSKAQLLDSLVSNEPSTRWAGQAHIALRSETATKGDTRISHQLRADFLGVAVDGGPTVNFRREYNSTAFILSETLHPVLLPDVSFDFYKRDKSGTIIRKNGKPERRFLVLTCETNLFFETEYTGGGSFYFHGVGGGQSFHRRYANNVVIASRRITLPETIDGKVVTFGFVRKLCQEDFLKAQITNNMTVKDSLNMMMKNLLANLRFTHPKTTCVSDSQCKKWYNGLVGIVRNQNVARCVEEPRERFRSCELRGIDNQNCPVIDSKGKRISDGNFEFVCDKGYRCVKTRNAGWFQDWSVYKAAKGKCVRQ